MQAQREALAALMRQVGEPSCSGRRSGHSGRSGCRSRSRSRSRRRHSSSGGKSKQGCNGKDVCSFYLCSICPYALLSDTKDSIGHCRWEHDDLARADYLRARERRDEKAPFDIYEENSLKCLRNILRGRDDYIISRLEQAEAAEKRHSEQEVQPAGRLPASGGGTGCPLARLAAEAEEHTRVAEELGSSGHICEAEAALAAASRATLERDALLRTQALHGRRFSRARAVLGPKRPCEVCGAMIPVDAEADFVEGHENGKSHQAWALLRSEYRRLRKRAEEVAGSSSVRTSAVLQGRPVATPSRGWAAADRAEEAERAAARGASNDVAMQVARRAAQGERDRYDGTDSRSLLRDSLGSSRRSHH